MELNVKLPPYEVERLFKILNDNEKIRHSQVSDLTFGRRFGSSYIVTTDSRIILLDQFELVRTLNLSKIREIKTDELFGSGRLVATLNDGSVEQTLIYYSRAFVPEFSAIAKRINDSLHHLEPETPEQEERAFCQNCGSPLPERGANCPLCVSRLKVLMYLLRAIKPYQGKALLLLLTTFVAVGAEMIPPYVTKILVDNVVAKKQSGELLFWIGVMLASGIVLLAGRWIRGSLTSWIGIRVVADLRSRLHTILQRQRMTYFDRRDSGELIARVMHDTEDLQQFLIGGLPFLVVQSMSLIVIGGILLYLDVTLAILVFLPGVFLLGGSKWFWRKLVPLFHKHGSKIDTLHSVLGESIHGIKTVKAFSREKSRMILFNRTNENLFGIRVLLEQTYIGFSEIMLWIMSMGLVSVWYVSIHRITSARPDLTLGDLFAFVAYITLFYTPLQWFTATMNWMTRAFSGAERVFTIMDAQEEVYEPPNAITIPRVQGAIQFKDVRFSYDRGKEALRGVSFDIKPGEMIGLVGKSGVGKSTIINLICRFYDADSGLITIDGYSIKRIKLEFLRQHIGLVMQDPFLFNTSIMENIRYALPSATFEDVVRAAKAANAHDFIIDKEDGYDTFIGERGAQLSGGEKQRIAIARAILHNPSILILDEATSAVDIETERTIQQAIANLVRGRTTIAIAHRLSTLHSANRLIVVEDGRIAEIGTHDELLDQGGIYARLSKL